MIFFFDILKLFVHFKLLSFGYIQVNVSMATHIWEFLTQLLTWIIVQNQVLRHFFTRQKSHSFSHLPTVGVEGLLLTAPTLNRGTSLPWLGP